MLSASWIILDYYKSNSLDENHLHQLNWNPGTIDIIDNNNDDLYMYDHSRSQTVCITTTN